MDGNKREEVGGECEQGVRRSMGIFSHVGPLKFYSKNAHRLPSFPGHIFAYSSSKVSFKECSPPPFLASLLQSYRGPGVVP